MISSKKIYFSRQKEKLRRRLERIFWKQKKISLPEFSYHSGNVRIRISNGFSLEYGHNDEKLCRGYQSILTKVLQYIKSKSSSVETDNTMSLSTEEDGSDMKQDISGQSDSGVGAPQSTGTGAQCETHGSCPKDSSVDATGYGVDSFGHPESDFSDSGDPKKPCAGFNDQQGCNPSSSQQCGESKAVSDISGNGQNIGDNGNACCGISHQEKTSSFSFSFGQASWIEEEAKKILDEDEGNAKPQETIHLGGGGGRQINTVLYSPNKNLKLLKTLKGCLSSRQPFGIDVFTEGKKVYKKDFVKGCILPHKILDCFKDSKQGGIYIIMDTSGSVEHFSKMILEVLHTAKLPDNVYVWSGSEAHPNKNEKTGRSYEYEHDFFLDLKRFLSIENPPIGSKLIFWGDLHDVYIKNKEAKIRKLLIPYKAFWLHCCDEKCNYVGCEKEEARKAGFKIFKNVNSTDKFVCAIKTIGG